MRRVRPIVAVAALAAVLAGCASIPRGGAVSSLEISADDAASDPLTLPEGPQPDATPEQIVQGFIRAGRGPQDNYRVAREFLTDELAQSWSPIASVLVSASAIAPAQLDDDSWELTIGVSASVDAGGRYAPTSSAESRTLDFDLVQNADGQWRISSAPDGTVLPPSRFETVFTSYPLYYFDPSYRYLVPELRWFPRSSTVARRIVSELVAGQSSWLSSGVLLSAFPTGTEAGAVDVQDGEASVALSNEVVAAPDLSKWRMLQQLSYSLAALGEVQSVVIEVSGVPVAVPDDLETPPDRYLSVDPSLVGVVDDGFGVVGADGTTPLPGLSVDVAQLRPTGASLARDRSAVALRGADGAGAILVARDAAPVVLDDRAGLAVPSLDPWGFTWSVPQDDPAGLVAIEPTGAEHPLPLPVTGRVVSIDVSRDGTRLLIGVDGADGPRLVVLGIDRDDARVPTALVQGSVVTVGSGRLVDATWVDTSSVAALVVPSPASDPDITSVVSVTLGGTQLRLGEVRGGSVLVSGNGLAGLRLVDAEGEVFRPSGGQGWFDTGTRVALLATPG